MDDIIRRDPRAERIARNRLHPDYDSVSASSSLMVGGINRKDVHNTGILSAEGIKRIDRSGAAVAKGLASQRLKEATLPLHAIPEPEGFIVVFSDADSDKLTVLDKDMLGLAHQLSATYDNQTAVLFISLYPRTDDLSLYGAHRTLTLSSTDYSPEVWLRNLLVLEDTLQPKHWVFADGSLCGSDLARRLAVSLKERPVTRGKHYLDGTLNCGSGDASKSVDRAVSRILLVEEQVADPISGFVTEAEEIAHLAGSDSHAGIEDLGQVAVDPANIPLAETRFILSGGNGVRNWALFHQCAKTLGATEGASRVAVDNGFMPRTTQVGATGTYVNAKVYVAVGISGAIQHLQGMTHCDTVIAINADPNCDMVKRADLSVIADSSEVMQALVNAIEGSDSAGVFDHAG
ncbi:electron transfer flavoprotein subunit alpha/FixB family protein [Enterovibrio sp. ZSDZ35]|uniref:Electron transfer flavoprotein subunit alpha/FixB family protein n=1 Tax=Enterovibrio qingdaonensis TaxID=2899818 RepID=A0ABT5QRM5_9GAMM|nr:electron transfer flavoprotein subunit alpha/FixB family protein [Enterovibrio sp. ZSDZ35]MDD1783640.1 electron transfer flavoprotein subunit alpha/FixB family protein [Enterovibrio sp. ZSDZ35]